MGGRVEVLVTPQARHTAQGCHLTNIIINSVLNIQNTDHIVMAPSPKSRWIWVTWTWTNQWNGMLQLRTRTYINKWYHSCYTQQNYSKRIKPTSSFMLLFKPVFWISWLGSLRNAQYPICTLRLPVPTTMCLKNIVLWDVYSSINICFTQPEGMMKWWWRQVNASFIRVCQLPHVGTVLAQLAVNAQVYSMIRAFPTINASLTVFSYFFSNK